MINSQTTKNLYRGNGSTLSYPVTYPFYEAENLLVLVAVGEVEETLSLGADYSVAINTDGSGGTVTFTSAERVPAGCTIAIMLNMALVQELDLSAVSHIDTESLEQELDKQVQYIQQISEGLSRAVRTNATSEISPDRLVSNLFAARDESVAAKNAAETAQDSAEAARDATEIASALAKTTISEAGAAQVSNIQSEGTTQKMEMQSLVDAASGYAELAHNYAQQVSPDGLATYLKKADLEDIYVRTTVTLSDALKAGTPVEVPKHTVGGDGMAVYLCGVLCERGENFQYLDVDSTHISFVDDLEAGMDIAVVSFK